MNILFRSPVTFAMMAVCIIAYIKQLNDSMFTQKFCFHSQMVQLGQYYRLLTGAFLHGSHWHILMNMYSLYNLGGYMEYLLGPVRYLIVLIGGIIVGNLFCYLMKVRSSVGMSGGLYALMFFYFALLYRFGYTSWGSVLQNNIANIMINFIPGVAWQAHLGGAAFGVIMAAIFR